MARLSQNYQAVLRSILDSQKLAPVSVGAELLFYKLLLASDCEGRYHGTAFQVFAKVFTKKAEAGAVELAEVKGWLNELAAARLIKHYEVDGEALLVINNYYDPTEEKRKNPKFPKNPLPGTAPLGEGSGGQAGDEWGTDVPEMAPLTPTPTPTPTLLSANAEPGDKPPQKPARAKSRVSGKAELNAAITALEDRGEPLPSKTCDLAERYRAFRAERRWPVWKQSQWGSNFEAARFGGVMDASALDAAFDVAMRSGHQSIHPKASGSRNGTSVIGTPNAPGSGQNVLAAIRAHEAERLQRVDGGRLS